MRTFQTDPGSRQAGPSINSVMARFHDGNFEGSLTRPKTLSGAAFTWVLADSRSPTMPPRHQPS